EPLQIFSRDADNRDVLALRQGENRPHLPVLTPHHDVDLLHLAPAALESFENRVDPVKDFRFLRFHASPSMSSAIFHARWAQFGTPSGRGIPAASSMSGTKRTSSGPDVRAVSASRIG